MRTVLLLSLAALIAPPSQASDFHSALYKFERDTTPAIFVNASGEGCCNFTAELEGKFRLNVNNITGQVSAVDVSVVLASVITWRGARPVTDPSEPYYDIGRGWLEGKNILTAIPGILGEATGQREGNTSYSFGPGTEDQTEYNAQYAWDYEIVTNGSIGRLIGKSLFLGDDGAYFYVDATLREVVPEPNVMLLGASTIVFGYPFLRRRRGSIQY
jgi:hypothetical protein